MIGSRELFVPECRIDPGWSLYDWLRKRPPPHQHPIRCKTKTQSRLGRPRFPALEKLSIGIVQLPREHSSLTVSFHIKVLQIKISHYQPPKVSKVGHKPSDGRLVSRIGL